MANVLDKFVPDLVDKIDIARAKGFLRFQCWHPTGDRIEVKLQNGNVRAIRYARMKVDGVIQEHQMVELVTTYEQLKRDVVTGIVSKQAEDWRG